jgi:hypothetical protein
MAVDVDVDMTADTNVNVATDMDVDVIADMNDGDPCIYGQYQMWPKYFI